MNEKKNNLLKGINLPAEDLFEGGPRGVALVELALEYGFLAVVVVGIVRTEDEVVEVQQAALEPSQADG